MDDCAETTPSSVSLQQPCASRLQLCFARNVPPIYSLITITVAAASSSGVAKVGAIGCAPRYFRYEICEEPLNKSLDGRRCSSGMRCDPSMEEPLHEIPRLLRFVQLGGLDTIPDATTILNVRRLLETHIKSAD